MTGTEVAAGARSALDRLHPTDPLEAVASVEPVGAAGADRARAVVGADGARTLVAGRSAVPGPSRPAGRLSSGLRTVGPVLFRRGRRARHRASPLPGGLAPVRARRWGRPLAATRFAVVDVETTGLRPGHDRVIEVAVVTTDTRGRVVDEWSALVDPGCDPGPTSVHGITEADLRSADAFASVAPELAERLRGAVLVGHNLAFDAAFLAAEGWALVPRATGADDAAALPGPGPGSSVLAGVQAGLCTLQLSRSLVPRPEAGWSLGSLCEAVGVPLTDPHRALADARATAGLLAALLEVAPKRRRPFARRLTTG